MSSNKLYRLVVAVVAAAVMFASCEKTINVKLPPVTPKLVVNCTAPAGDVIHVSVSRSGTATERRYGVDLSIRNATVQLYVDGVLAETLVNDSTGLYHSLANTTPGKQYQLRVSAPGYTSVATTAVAQSAIPLSVSKTSAVRKDADGNWQDLLTINFTDPCAASDFYIVRITVAPDTFQYNYYSFCVNSPDASVETIGSDIADDNTCLDNNNIFFRDELFNGQAKDLKLYVPAQMIAPRINGTDTLYASVELYHVSEDYFRFVKSSIIADNANGDPFSEPVNVYTNVTNGYGIFAIFAAGGVQVR